MNKVFLIGRLVAKPLLQSTGAVNFTRFCIAITRKYTNSEGFKETDFINVLVWNKQAENICNYLDKGNQIAIEGRIQTNKYQDKDGNNRVSFEVVADNVQFLEPKKNHEEDSKYSDSLEEKKHEDNPYADFGDTIELSDINLDDELAF
nr:MAG TPA: Single strand binding protein [Bacteriophage sp.]